MLEFSSDPQLYSIVIHYLIYSSCYKDLPDF